MDFSIDRTFETEDGDILTLASNVVHVTDYSTAQRVAMLPGAKGDAKKATLFNRHWQAVAAFQWAKVRLTEWNV